MNQELLKEREKFKKSFLAVHSSGGGDRATTGGSAPKRTEKEKKSGNKNAEKEKVSAKAKLDLAHLKSMGGGGSQFKFGVLTKIVRRMKARHMEGEDMPLTLGEILDETHQLDIDSKTKYWLETEALRNNPKISASVGSGKDGQTTYMFKPPFSILNRKALLKLLKQYSIKGKGGIMLEDLQESLPRCDAIIKTLETNGDIWIVVRPGDKKKIVYYHDSSDDFSVDEDMVRLWRSVAVEGKDDINIDEYLEKQGIKSMTDQGLKKAVKRKPIKRNVGKRKRALKDNLHIAHELEDYSEMTAQSFKK